jgi:hypothetical protein
MFSGGGAGGNGCAAADAVTGVNIGFDGGIATGIDDLAGADGGNLRGHVSAISLVRVNLRLYQRADVADGGAIPGSPPGNKGIIGTMKE